MVNTLHKIWTWYLRPKDFEYHRKGTIYNLIGIESYKKYLPTTGDLVRRWRGSKQLEIGKTNRYSELRQYELKTRNYEWRHIFGGIAFVVLVFVIDKKLTLFDWIFLTALNLYVNIYPIFLQRYNRIRILDALRKMDRQKIAVVS